MPDYKILGVEGPQEWEGQYGPMHSYTLTLEGVEKPVDINQKPTSAAPHGAIALTLSENPKFPAHMKGKRDQIASFNGGGGRPPESPERQHMIVRQHSQTVAVEILKAKIQVGEIKPELTMDSISKLCDLLDADVRAGVKKALEA